MTEEEPKTEQIPIKEEEEFITKPKKKRDVDYTDGQKKEFVERMRKAKETKKTKTSNELKSYSVAGVPPVEPMEEPAIIEPIKRQSKTLKRLETKPNDVEELLNFVREYKTKKETKREPAKVKPDDVYRSRVIELKEDYLKKQIYRNLFGEN